MKGIIIQIALLFFVNSCYKLEENDRRYTGRKLQKMLEGTWKMEDYQIMLVKDMHFIHQKKSLIFQVCF